MGWLKRTMVVGALVLAFLPACTSPTLPLPPPAAPQFSLGSDPDTYKLTSVSGADPDALIVILNRNESLQPYERVSGTIADSSGSWTAVVKATKGDVLDISQESGTTRSSTTTITLR